MLAIGNCWLVFLLFEFDEQIFKLMRLMDLLSFTNLHCSGYKDISLEILSKSHPPKKPKIQEFFFVLFVTAEQPLVPLSGPVDTVQLSDLDCSFKKHYKQSNKTKANTANMDMTIVGNADSKNKGR